MGENLSGSGTSSFLPESNSDERSDCRAVHSAFELKLIPLRGLMKSDRGNKVLRASVRERHDMERLRG